MTDLKVTFDVVDLPAGADASVTVWEDQNADGNPEYSATATLSDGVTEYTLTGFQSAGNSFYPEITLSNTDPEETAKITEPVTIETATLPVTIDGEPVKEITIDGEVVTGLTIDGTTVF